MRSEGKKHQTCSWKLRKGIYPAIDAFYEHCKEQDKLLKARGGREGEFSRALTQGLLLLLKQQPQNITLSEIYAKLERIETLLRNGAVVLQSTTKPIEIHDDLETALDALKNL